MKVKYFKQRDIGNICQLGKIMSIKNRKEWDDGHVLQV